MKGLQEAGDELGVWPQIEAPEHLTPEQKVTFQNLWTASRDKSSGFDIAAIEALATNPDVMAKYTKAHRELTIKKVAQAMSIGSDQFLGLPLDVVKTVLSLSPTDMRCVMGTAQTIKTSGLQLDNDEIRAAIDMAKVIHVMEEEDAQDGDLEETKSSAPDARIEHQALSLFYHS